MALSNLIENIEQGSGKFDTEKSYFINNSTDEDIEVTWAAQEPEAKGHGKYLIKAGERGGPYPQFLAYHIVKALVSREMMKEGKSQFFLSAEMRKPYEEKYLVEIEGNPQDALTQSIREEERKKILEEMKTQPVSDGMVTSSETRRKALEKDKETKKQKESKEFEDANV